MTTDSLPSPLPPPPADCLPLPRPESGAHIWQLCLATVEPWQGNLFTCLSDDERQRMQRFRRPQDQRRYGISRAALRHLLGAYLGVPGASLGFGYGDYGKPHLIGQQAATLEFNVSHSEDWALLAIGSVPLGVDLEIIHPLKQLSGLVKTCLTPAEQACLQGLNPEQMANQFFRYWTCKEAYLKAIGHGLRQSMQSISLDFDQAKPYPPDPHLSQLSPIKPWQIFTWTPQTGMLAALAVSGSHQPDNFQIRRYALPLDWLLRVSQI